MKVKWQKRETGVAKWNSVPLLNVICQQEEEEEGKKEEEEGAFVKEGEAKLASESVDREEMSTGGKRKSRKRVFFSFKVCKGKWQRASGRQKHSEGYCMVSSPVNSSAIFFFFFPPCCLLCTQTQHH